MSIKIQCDELRLREYYSSAKCLYVGKIYNDIKQYGIIALLSTGTLLFFLGEIGRTVGILLLWLLVSYYLIGWLHVTITKDKIRRNLTWGLSKVEVRKSSIRYTSVSAKGLSLSYYIPCYALFSSLALRFF